MKALAVRPGTPRSARLMGFPEPARSYGPVLIQTIAVGICGTDREIVEGEYGSAPPGEEYLILGHESLGRVLEAPVETGLAPGDLAVAIVRRPDPVPCPNCAVGEWDMCRNGLFTEHGIKQLHGFCSERFRTEPSHAVRVDPGLASVGVLLEPASVVAKAWDHIERIGNRTQWQPRRVTVTGAGPIGLLASLMAVQRGFDVNVVDIVTEGPKPDLVKRLGASYHVRDLARACSGADILLECTGIGQLVFEAMQCTAPGGVVCLTGISSGGRRLETDMAAVGRSLVLSNDVVFGSVNANRRHYEAAAASLAAADSAWLEALITRRVPLESWQDALERRPMNVKTVIEFDALAH